MRRERAPLLGVAALWSLGVFALWAAPVARDFVRLSGFVDITPRLGREWPLPVALSSWGLLLPLAVTGGWMIVRLKPRPALLAFIAGTGGLLLLSILRGALGWTLAGNATLLHQGRVWPHAHLLAAVCAGVALCWLWTRIREHSRPLAVTLCSLLLAAGAVSPALASVAFTRMMDRGGSGFVYGGEDLAPGSFVRRAAAHLSSDSVVDTSADPLLGFTLWQLSGCRLTGYDDPALPGNDLRIRFRDLATEWQQTGGQAPSTHVLIGGRVPGAVESGTFRGVTFSLVPAR